MISTHDMALRQGNTFRRRFRFRGLSGDVLNLTGSVIAFSAGTGCNRIQFETGRDAGLTMTPLLGEVELLLTAPQTREMTVGIVPYEIERRILDERTGQWDETTILTGFIVVERGINDER
ncbi:hypothetical protein [Aureimonas sp. N4]|uniref:hypothetical protein n=1 Tax=Aureimonas sp. N4 TaxID=1638165 RepID=UPI000780468E|nr:hypothetical protein [Aureimonas sp. N4]